MKTLKRYERVVFFNRTATTGIYTLSLPAALPISSPPAFADRSSTPLPAGRASSTRPTSSSRSARPPTTSRATSSRSEEHTSELQSRQYLVCRLLLEKTNRPPDILVPVS